MKQCTVCGEEKPITEFRKNTQTKSGIGSRCKPCDNAKNRAWREANPEKVAEFKRRANARKQETGSWRNSKYLAAYGITLDNYELIAEDQGNCCAICGEHRDEHDRALAVDHSHETGFIRGLLCLNCNHGLGKFKDDFDRLLGAFAHLDPHEPVRPPAFLERHFATRGA